jgi:hypothetical protein
VVGMLQNLDIGSKNKPLGKNDKNKSLFDKLSRINSPQEVNASKNGIDSFIIKKMNPPALLTKTRIYLEKGKLGAQNSLTPG